MLKQLLQQYRIAKPIVQYGIYNDDQSQNFNRQMNMKLKYAY